MLRRVHVHANVPILHLAWIRTLDKTRKLGARTVCPGHGPIGDATILEDQQAYFRSIWDRKTRLKRRSSRACVRSGRCLRE
jgi:glyoxylase-like metal-dependent hydrolase (beta-lactamase superfamily II)